MPTVTDKPAAKGKAAAKPKAPTKKAVNPTTASDPRTANDTRQAAKKPKTAKSTAESGRVQQDVTQAVSSTTREADGMKALGAMVDARVNVHGAKAKIPLKNVVGTNGTKRRRGGDDGSDYQEDEEAGAEAVVEERDDGYETVDSEEEPIKKKTVKEKKREKERKDKMRLELLDDLQAQDVVSRVLSDLLGTNSKRYKAGDLGKIFAAASVSAITKVAKVGEVRLQHDKEWLEHSRDPKVGAVMEHVLKIVEKQVDVATLREERMSKESYFAVELAKHDPKWFPVANSLKDMAIDTNEVEKKRLGILENLVNTKCAAASKVFDAQERLFKLFEAGLEDEGKMASFDKLYDVTLKLFEKIDINLDLCHPSAFLKGGALIEDNGDGIDEEGEESGEGPAASEDMHDLEEGEDAASGDEEMADVFQIDPDV